MTETSPIQKSEVVQLEAEWSSPEFGPPSQWIVGLLISRIRTCGASPWRGLGRVDLLTMPDKAVDQKILQHYGYHSGKVARIQLLHGCPTLPRA